jgi:hypothetical protein
MRGSTSVLLTAFVLKKQQILRWAILFGVFVENIAKNSCLLKNSSYTCAVFGNALSFCLLTGTCGVMQMII